MAATGHLVRITSRLEPANLTIAPGETYRKTFESAGTFSFLCVIHPEMQGTVTVTGGHGGGATPWPAATPRPAPTPPPQPTPGTGSGGPANVAIVDLDLTARRRGASGRAG